MNWKPVVKPTAKKQRELFIELSQDEQLMVDILQQKESIHIDELYFKSNLNSSAVAAALLMLEMQGIVASLPGKLYKII
jgi:DNA processing protein